MGTQIRRRTKGKSGWLNFSASKKNGVQSTGSVKFTKNITMNTGNSKRPGRVTVNLGNGVRHVFYGKRGPKALSWTFLVIEVFFFLLAAAVYVQIGLWQAVAVYAACLLVYWLVKQAILGAINAVKSVVTPTPKQDNTPELTAEESRYIEEYITKRGGK